MDYTVEVIIFVIMVLLVSTRPEGFMSIGTTIIGRAMILVLIVCLSLKSTIGGLLGALLLVVVSESIIESMEGENETKGSETKKSNKKKKEAAHHDSSECESDDEHCDSKKKKEDKAKHSKVPNKEKLKNMIGGTDIVSLTEKFSKLRSLADAINRAQ